MIHFQVTSAGEIHSRLRTSSHTFKDNHIGKDDNWRDDKFDDDLNDNDFDLRGNKFDDNRLKYRGKFIDNRNDYDDEDWRGNKFDDDRTDKYRDRLDGK